MTEQDKLNFFNLIKSTAEYYSKNLSNPVLKFYWDDLNHFSFLQIENALTAYRCDKKNKFMPTSGEIIDLMKSEKRNPAKLTCSYLRYGQQCMNEIFMMHPRPVCEEHYDAARKKSDIELEIEHRAKVYATAQKASGMTAKEFAYEILENYGVKSIFKKDEQVKQIKDILIKQNSQFALTEEVEN